MSRMISAPDGDSPGGEQPVGASTHVHDDAAPRRVIREVFVIALGALLYFWVRGLMETRAAVAFANAEWLIGLEQQLGLFQEPWLQSHVLGHRWSMTLANQTYIFGHWPVIVMTMSWLIWKHRDQFALYRSALLLSGAIGLVFFMVLPMAPPRLVDDYGFVDTVTQSANAYRVLQPPSFTNQFAAMPSLHVGWNLLMGIAIARCSTNSWAKAFGVIMPVVMFLATIVTANHYVLDGLVGSMIALVGLLLAWQVSQPTERPALGTPVPKTAGRVLGQG